MESILNQIRNLIETYGFQMTLLITLVIALTNFTKKPIMNYAIKFAEKSGYDKSLVTKYVVFIPLFYVFILLVLLELITKGPSGMLWDEIMSNTPIYTAVSISTYEVGKKFLQSYASKKNVVQNEIDLDSYISLETYEEVVTDLTNKAGLAEDALKVVTKERDTMKKLIEGLGKPKEEENA